MCECWPQQGQSQPYAFAYKEARCFGTATESFEKNGFDMLEKDLDFSAAL